jgi:hypothetical protein
MCILRIFDLGLRKFGSSSEFILAYLDYLSHLNEDNNTRVLFERVLTQVTIFLFLFLARITLLNSGNIGAQGQS